MQLTTYCFIDNNNMYTGHQRTNLVPTDTQFIAAEPPEINVGQKAYWIKGTWQISRSEEGTKEARLHAMNNIDDAADKARCQNQSIGQLLDVEYMQVEQAHARWYASGYSEQQVPDEIRSWADAKRISVMEAARDIAEASAIRQDIICRIRDIRLKGKAAIQSAPDNADFEKIALTFITQFATFSIN